MNEKVRILIVDDNQKFVGQIKQYFCNHAVINVVLEAYEGKEGLEVVVNPEKRMTGKPLTQEEVNWQNSLVKTLHSLGIPSHLKGYTYLKEGIFLIYEDESLINEMMKKLYPKIALDNNTTPIRVERAMRNAIEVGWNRGDYELMEEIFGHSISFNKTKPTNSEFLITIAEKLKIDKLRS